jgi:beta-lactamase superfamily II metal-dependent hydrolase
MTSFTLEALDAKHGDSLLLHWGNERLIVIDGGPSGVFRKTLLPRLEAIRAERDIETLPIRMLMVSHIDDDHIHGVLDWTRHMADLRKETKPVPWEIKTLWHNAFDDIVGNVEPLSTALGAAVAPVMNDDPLPADLGLDRYGALVMASVAQGKTLRDDARALKLSVNQPFKGLVWASAAKKREVALEDGLTVRIIGPLEAQVEALRTDWDKKLQEMKKKKHLAEAQAIAADFVDKSVYNLSSIVVLASLGGRRMLLTGDARGDFVREGLRDAGLLKNDKIHVDLLKVPHHGSARNVRRDFFEQVTADHYVISADGQYGNPDVEMLKMLTEARGAAEYTIHLTNKVADVKKFFDKDLPKGRKYKVVYREDAEPSVSVALGA